MKRGWCMGFVAALALAGCGKKDSGDKRAEPAVATTGSGGGSALPTPAPAGSNAAPAPTGPVDVPTEVDFEVQAQADITKANVDTKVKAIEDQLGQQ